MARRLLYLCHANIVRSPAAELLSRARTDLNGEWAFASAGIHALAGHPVDPDMAAALAGYGIHANGRPGGVQLDDRGIASADLILAFEARHRNWVVRHAPAAAKRTLTIRRAERLLRARPRRAEILSVFATDDLAYTPEDDFADPVGQGPAAAVAAAAEIARLLDVILPAVGATR